MRSTCRAFMAAILFTATAGVALAQDASSAPPPAAPHAAKPVAELPPIPFAKPHTAAVEPAVETGQVAPAGEPVASAAVAPATEKPVATTSRRVAKESAPNPADTSSVQVTESFQQAAGPVAGTSAIAPPPAARPAAVESSVEVTKPRRTMGPAGWLLFGITIVGLFLAITAIRRRRAQTNVSLSIVDLATAPEELAPVLLPRR